MSNKEEILNSLLKNNNLVESVLKNSKVSSAIIEFLKSYP